MTGNEKTTALIPSVGADGGQPPHDSTNQSIPHETCESNPPEENIEEMREKIRRMNDPRYLHTVSMTELYQTAYKSRPPIIDGLLYAGAYILAGAPKIGKSFLVAQLAYHVSTGQRLWGYEVHQGTVLYLALEDDFQRIQSRMFKSLVGTVKETITQVSSSKKWKSLPAVDEQGRPILQKNGKPVLRKSYSVLQDDFFNAMRTAGYTDVERGERGSTEEHLTVAQFKTEREQERLAALERQVEKKEKILQKVEQKIVVQKGTAATFTQIDGMGRKTLLGKVEFSQQEAEDLKQLAKKGIAADTTIKDLQRDLKSARRDAQIWKRRYEELKEQAKDFLAAVRKAPERVMAFISKVLHTEQAEPPRFQRQRESAVER